MVTANVAGNAHPSHRKENPVRKQELGGKVKKAKGRVKEAVGILSGNRQLEREGSAQRLEGAVEEGLGKARRRVGEVLANLGNAVKK
jgi:uncharacterized protein YjbJ (UPF0337 family)